MNNMQPEPPPPTGEADYSTTPRRMVNTAPFEPDSHQPFGVDDIPIPAHLESLPPTPDLNAAWAAVLASDHEPIPKRGYNTFFKYNYATADDIRLYVGRELGKNGLHYEQHMAGYTVWGNLIRVTYYFVIRHSSGQSSSPIRHDELARTTSEKGAPDDKALGKAGVLALKNFSKVHFSVDTGDLVDDPDGDGPVAEPARNQASRPKQDGGAGNAFRSAGLPPPKAQQTPMGQTFADRVAISLDAEPNGTKWLKILDAAYASAQSLDDIGSIRAVESFKVAQKNAPSLMKQRMSDMEREAIDRLNAAIDNTKHDLEGAGVSHNVAEAVTGVADALAAEKTDSEWMPGDP